MSLKKTLYFTGEEQYRGGAGQSYALCIQESEKFIVSFIDFQLDPQFQLYILFSPSTAPHIFMSQTSSVFHERVSSHLGCRSCHVHPAYSIFHPASSVTTLPSNHSSINMWRLLLSTDNFLPTLFFGKIYMCIIYFWDISGGGGGDKCIWLAITS